MSLDLTPVHRNLHTKVTFLGLEFEDLILVLALAALMNLLAHFVSGNAHVFGIPLNVFMEFVVPALAVPFLILFKYGRPRGYLTDLVRSFTSPGSPRIFRRNRTSSLIDFGAAFSRSRSSCQRRTEMSVMSATIFVPRRRLTCPSAYSAKDADR